MAYLANSIEAQAYKGQSVMIILLPEYVENMINLSVGKLVQNEDGKIGVVSEIDTYGNSFKVAPLQPDLRFDSIDTPGILQKTNITLYEP